MHDCTRERYRVQSCKPLDHRYLIHNFLLPGEKDDSVGRLDRHNGRATDH